MIKILYHVPRESAADERAWLKDQKIYPAQTETARFDTKGNVIWVAMFGMILSQEQAVMVLFRHPEAQQYEHKA